ncbi:MAG TPA: LLM class flavin-dependent oxidoreductase [Miltoncostaeaceae bacterium]|nr:LLM class flavin-dependent oxidoreductase [Miltoncostaeaceae bacterium]
MRVGLRLPQYGSSWDALLDVATRAARAGADHLWVNDHLQSPGRLKAEPTLEAFTTLAALAVRVPGVRLGVAVASASYRPAPLLAKMATVVDVLSGGRMILGVGTGSDRPEHAAYGFPLGTPGERTARLRATLDVLEAMARHPDGADLPGVLADAPNRPAAVQPGGIPVWVAAHGPVLLRTAGRRADGIVSAWIGPDELAERIAVARDAAEAAGRPAPAVALYTFALAVPSRAEALGWLGAEAEALGTSPASVLRWAEGRGLVGEPAALRERVAALEAAGATDLILALPGRVPPEAFLALLEALAPLHPGDAAAPAPAAAVPVDAGDGSARDNLVHLLVERHREAGRGGDPAVEDETGTWTYDDLGAALRRAAGALHAHGVRRGDRVGVALRDGRPWVAAFLGAAALGAVPVPVDPASPADRVALVLDDCLPALVVAEDDVPVGAHPRLAPEALAEGPVRPVAAVHPDDLAYLIYSSGSTGRPKGVMHAHRDLATAVEGYAREVLGLGPGDRCHSAARLFTSLGFGNGFFRPLGRGATAVLSGARPNPRGTLTLVRERGVTVLTAVPTFWAQVATFLERHPDPEALAGVRIGVSSGDRLPEAVGRRLVAGAGLALVEGLGCSECSNIVLSTRPGDPLDGTLGRPVAGVEIDLRDPEGRSVGDGDPGRLWIRSDSNTTGYWRRIAQTRDLLHGEWLRMGDVLTRRDGVYRHVGRADDMFKVDARWVSPGEVEGSLLELPEVAEAAVAGVADRDGLLRVHAWVVASGDTPPDAGALRRHVAHALAPHMAPQSVTVLPALPRLPSGKIDRRALRGEG